MSGGPGERYARGEKAWGICARCGLRSLLNDLVFDGYLAWLRVHPECRDQKHPQERLVRVTDPVALWRPSPEDDLNVAPVLSGVQNGSENDFTWTAASMQVGRIESYALYRSTDGVEFSLVVDQGVTYEWDGAILDEPLDYNDTVLPPADLYYYYVVALDIYNRGLRSNTITIAVPIETFFRLLESGDLRSLEDGDLRVTEAAP